MKNTILYMATVLIWGTTFYAIKLQLGVVEPFVSVTYRFAIAGLLLLGYCAVTKRLKTKLSTRQHLFMAIMGLTLFSANYYMAYHGTIYVTSGLVALAYSTVTIMNILNQRLFFKIPVSKQVVLGTLIGLIGMAFVFSHEIENFSLADSSTKGLMLCLCGALMSSLGNMCSMKSTKLDIPITVSTAWGMCYGSIFSLIACLIMDKEFTFSTTPEYIGSLLYLTIPGSIIAFMCFLTLIKNIGADKAAYATIMFPAIALSISTYLEGYNWSTLAIAGAALILFGNFIAMRKNKGEKALTKIRG
ncbi:MAG: EamA family transporter [Micavibrio sp.]|nr:EamA family transporter [Micavibrio sp.]